MTSSISKYVAVSATAFGEEDHWKVEPFRQLEEAALFSMVLQTLGPGQHCVVAGHDDRLVTVEGTDSGDEPVGRCLLDEFVDWSPAALGRDDEGPVLHEAARVTQIQHVLSCGALARLSPAQDSGRAPLVKPESVTLLNLGQIRSHFIRNNMLHLHRLDD